MSDPYRRRVLIQQLLQVVGSPDATRAAKTAAETKTVAVDEVLEKTSLAGLHDILSSGAVPVAVKRKLAVIIKGNPKVGAMDQEHYDNYYEQIADYLRKKQYDVQFDAGEPYTQPPDADLWIGHSRGVDRLRFAPEGTRTLAFGSKVPGAINHPDEDTETPFHLTGESPGPAHYQFTDEMRAAIDGGPKMLEKISLSGLHDSIMSGGQEEEELPKKAEAKKAAAPYWQKGLQTQLHQPAWDTSRGILSNIGTNVSQAKGRAESMVRDRDVADDIRSELQPGFAMQRFQNYMRHGDHVKDPVDKVLFRNEPLF